MSIDVVMLTKDSNKPWFRRVLMAIKREIPVHHFILVDGYSTDGTVDVVKELFGSKVIVLRTRESLGGARYLGMKAVDTEWFAYIDSDVEILPGWFSAAERYMKQPYIYGIQGVFVSSINKEGRVEWKPSFVLLPGEKKSIVGAILRYGVNRLYGADSAHVLIRRNVINFIDPCFLIQLDRAEDTYIAWKIIEKGYFYLRISAMKAIHYGSYSLSKAMKRALGRNGLYYRIPYSVFVINNIFRFLAHIWKKDKATLVYLNELILSLPSYLKVESILKTCQENTRYI